METVRDLLASRLRFLRKSKGLKQADLAEAAGCEINTISRYERGVITPNIEHLLKLAEALGVSPMEILPPQDADKQRLIALRHSLTEKILQMENPEELEEVARIVEAFISVKRRPK